MLAHQPAGGVLALQIVEDDVLRNDYVAFHADHLGNVRDAARAVAQAAAWMMTSTEPTMISRTVFGGSENPPIAIIASMRFRHSAGCSSG